MKTSDVEVIEKTLGVELPGEYRKFLVSTRNYDEIDDVSVIDAPERIITSTIEHRKGFWGQKPWPTNLVYVGNERDASPYALNCDTGEFQRLYHGNIEKPPRASFESFGEFVSRRVEEYRIELENENAPPLTGFPKLRMEIASHFAFYGRAYAALIIVFVVWPLCAYSISELIRHFRG